MGLRRVWVAVVGEFHAIEDRAAESDAEECEHRECDR